MTSSTNGALQSWCRADSRTRVHADYRPEQNSTYITKACLFLVSFTNPLAAASGFSSEAGSLSSLFTFQIMYYMYLGALYEGTDSVLQSHQSVWLTDELHRASVGARGRNINLLWLCDDISPEAMLASYLRTLSLCLSCCLHIGNAWQPPCPAD